MSHLTQHCSFSPSRPLNTPPLMAHLLPGQRILSLSSPELTSSSPELESNLPPSLPPTFTREGSEGIVDAGAVGSGEEEGSKEGKMRSLELKTVGEIGNSMESQNRALGVNNPNDCVRVLGLESSARI
ncbi:hypothetical protein C2S51_028225 [Perilla frutescens var. frutescens]|nr:hypothetical protein C2S51_028225 [Perilla frutescens var. frutescens]